MPPRPIIIDENNDVYVFGCNYYGQVGLGHNNNVITPTFLGLKGIKVFSGPHHTFLFDLNSNIWCFGLNGSGELGLGDNIHYNVPTKFDFMVDKIVDIKCGFNHTLILDTEGTVYSCGSNQYEQLGIGDNKNCNLPQKVKINNIHVQPLWQKIAVGKNHNLLLDNEGYVYSFGCNYDGQLGLGHTHNVHLPTKIVNLLNVATRWAYIVDILCYCNSSFLLDINNKVWCFGFNENGELGLGCNTNVNIPTINGGLINIVKLNDIDVIRFKKTKSARNV